MDSRAALSRSNSSCCTLNESGPRFLILACTAGGSLLYALCVTDESLRSTRELNNHAVPEGWEIFLHEGAAYPPALSSVMMNSEHIRLYDTADVSDPSVTTSGISSGSISGKPMRALKPTMNRAAKRFLNASLVTGVLAGRLKGSVPFALVLSPA